MSQGRFPPPEMVRFVQLDANYNRVLGPETPAYYYGQENRRFEIVPEENPDKRVDPQELPPLPKGRAWRFARTTEGKIYWVEDDAARVAADEKRKQEEARAWAERQKRIAEDVASSRSTAPPVSPTSAAGAGSQSGLAAMRQRIADNTRQLEQIFGGSVRVSETATGFKLELFEAKGGVSTSSGGRKLGNITLDKNGKPVAVDIPGATITEDGRIVVGKSVKLFGVTIHAKGAVSLEDGIRGLTSSIAEAVTNFGEGLGLGKTSADRVPGGG